MAFCNSCGTQLDVSAKFCAKCGATVPVSGFHAPASAAPVASAAPPAAAPQGGGALKVILIVVAVVIGLGILGAATAGFMAWRIARHTRVETNQGKVKVETPFGTVESTTDASEATRNLGVEVYPGARAIQSSAANVSMGGMHTVAAEFETDDAPDKVADFYNKKFPDATMSTSSGNHYSIVSMGDKGMITIGIDTEDGKTRIKIANVTGKSYSKTGSSD
jgi:hypothetical protein